MQTIARAAGAIALTGVLVGCSQGTPGTFTSDSMTCSGDPGAAGALSLPANATPPRTVPGGTLRAESARATDATLSRRPGDPAVITVKVGETFTVGSVTYTLVGSCAVQNPGKAPGTTTGIAYVVAKS